MATASTPSATSSASDIGLPSGSGAGMTEMANVVAQAALPSSAHPTVSLRQNLLEGKADSIR